MPDTDRGLQTNNAMRVNIGVSFVGKSFNNFKLTVATRSENNSTARATVVPTVWLLVTEGHIRPY